MISNEVTHAQTMFLLRNVPRYNRPLSIEEAARLLGVTGKTLEGVIYSKPGFPVLQVGIRRKMIKLNDLRDWLRNTPEGNRFYRRHHADMAPVLQGVFQWE